MNSQDPTDCREIPARRRRAPWAVAAAALALVVSVLVAPGASADMIGPYNIDGVVPDDTDPDLTPITDPAGNTKELGPLNASTTKIGVIHDDAPPTLGETNPNAQVDLNTTWLDTARVDDEDYLYFAWQRDKSTGSGFIAYEFMAGEAPVECAYGTATQQQLIDNCNPWANRAEGDFLILWDQQGGSTTLLVREWQLVDGVLTLSDAVELLDYDAEYSADGFRGEAAINLTTNDLGSGGACLAFANVIPSTVTGNSDSADYKDTILQKITLSNCESSTVTTPTDGSGTAITPAGISIGTGVLTVKDSAVVDVTGGTADPAGSVAFWLCKLDSGTCDGTTGKVGTSVGSTNLPAAATEYPVTVASPPAYVTSAGRYCWRATFTGDSVNSIPGSTDSSLGECFTVNPVTPTLTTQAGAAVYLGGNVTDTATLGGTATQPTAAIIHTGATPPAAGAPAGGSIVFKLYGPSTTACGPLVYTSAAVPVSGNGQYSPAPFAPQAPGEYHWVAEYSGNLPNTTAQTHNTACDVANEDVMVNTIPTTMSTAQRWVPNDSATVTASPGGNMKGTVLFEFFTNGTCAGDAAWTQPVAIPDAGGVPGAGSPSPATVSTTNTTAYTTSGSFSWRVSYDSTNLAHDDVAASCKEVSSLMIDNDNTLP